MILNKLTLKISHRTIVPVVALTRSIKRKTIAMNVAYFRHVQGESDFHVSMQFSSSQFAINKQLNFCRQLNEPVATFLRRIDANVEKIIDKKSKRKKSKQIESSEGNAAQRKADAKLVRDGCPVDAELSCSHIFADPAAYSLEILDQQLPVVINAPWIESIALPKLIMAGFLVYPSKFEAFFVDKAVSEWSWHRSIHSDRGWTECGRSAVYETKNEDVGHYLRILCLPKNKADGMPGPAGEAVSAAVVEAGPGPLPFQDRHRHTATIVGDDGFRVISYNILADFYVDSDYSRTVLFGYCPAYALTLPYRRQLLIKEILGYNSDIMSLQEVDTKVFRHDLLPLLEETQNMTGHFSQKGTTNEGTAIFYRKSKFKSLLNWSILLSDMLQKEALFSDILCDVKKNEKFFERIADRSTTLQVVLLECLKRPSHLLLVANVHLYFHPDADHVRILQGGLIVMYLENLLKNQRQSNPDKTISLVWCGDFNSVPECGIYELLTTGSVSSDHVDWKSNEAEAMSGIQLSHKLQLASACGTPPYTNYTVGFKACLDYIFYDRNNLKVSKCAPLPSEEELSTHLAIPSVVFPSDHVALISDLEFTA